MNNKKTATNRKGMIPNRLNKFSIRKYSVGTASILVGTTLIFGLSGHEAKAAEHTNGELNQSKNEATAPSENKTTEKVDSRQLKDNTQTVTADQPKVTMSDSATVKETSSNMQSPQNTTANQSTTQTSNVTTNDKSSTTYSNETDKSNLTQAKDVSTTPKTTTIKPRTLNRMAVNTVSAPQQGTNVNDKVHFSNIDIAIDKGHLNKDTGKTEFWATSSDVLKLKANYTIDDSVKEGDTFTFKYGQYFRPGSVRLPSQTQNLYNAQGNIIAKGIYDSTTNTTTYTFTNYVDQYTNVSGSFEQVAFAKRENATTDKTAYKMEVTLGNDKYSKDVIVDYGNKKGQQLISSTNYINNEDLSRNMTVYVNQPKNKYTKETLVTNLTGYKFNPDAKNFKIYEVTNQNQFVDSFTPDTSKLTDVTDKFKITYSNDNKTATVDLLNGQSSSDKQYIIQQVAYPDNSSTDNGKIDYTLETQNGKSSWSNSYSNVNGSSTANGDQKKYNLGDYVWEDTNKDGKQDANEKGIKGVYVILKDSNGKELDRTTTDENGKYQFTGLSDGTYSVEFSTPAGYTPTTANVGTDDAVDSDGLTTTGVIKDADNMTLDSGFYKTPKYSLGDYVWYDSNKDGKQDSTEKGIKGVKVTLQNEKGEVIGTTETDENGKYRFDNLDSGKYKVIFEKPAGLTQTGTNTTEDDKDADGGEVDVTITDHDDFTLDNGYYEEETS
ncbi:TPA: fibrinogen-binding adhesin SdrG C-terminal domain-containing protein, partial [Staphylococcus aureus]|nr:fibrinogen-binding adhesin SdrG C-terminal domain-containing protein [Staphylococcus aureus]HDL0469991.1 fibrinogen-binding adhesin SdrG C-terminal domain-containing protein [Staphylococcus aureus]HDL0478037.1 fibrinogen-binding adhesin SdrG C-terminal domain-containing protein [Staphylococcus aureus]HDL0537057.1 fibrinogen-binding adhesin SdrG C-terminal domain-containing protein [Staphylococcus aureus]HDL0545114.1 fibrinogen-binding adhesin SdrG C-terminal domain-containing protein [Staphy